MNLSDDPSLAHEFVVESLEMIDQVEPQLVEISENLDKEPPDQEIINTIFRLFHSMKGSAGFMNLNVVQNISHEAENLLDQIRQGKMKLTERHIDLLIRTCDFLRDLMEKIEVNFSDEIAKADAEIFTVELKQALVLDDDSPAKADVPASEPETQQPAAANPGADSTESQQPAAAGVNTPPPGNINDNPEGSNIDEARLFENLSELIGPFIQEAQELLDKTEQELLNLKKDTGRSDIMAGIIRHIHTLKGNSGMMGQPQPEKLSHRIESMMEYLYEGKLEVNEEKINLLLFMVDVLRESIVDTSEGKEMEIENLSVYLDLIQDQIELAPKLNPVEGKKAADIIFEKPLPPPTPSEPATMTGNPGPGEKSSPAPASNNAVPDMASSGNPGTTPTSSIDTGQQAPKAPGKTDGNGEKPIRISQAQKQDIRVDVKKLDILFDLVGELIIAESMVTHNPDIQMDEFGKFEKDARHLTKITRELHEITMSVRMVPVSGTFRKMRRLVHDLSHKNGKDVELVLIGEDTEVDKSVNEHISDPLVHMIRNAMDHGIETKEERAKTGKPLKGKVTLEARHEGNEVWIVLKDDGKGLDREKLISKAIEKGMIKGDGSDMKDEEVFNLIFEAGLSTADKVTNISGRGVGMDVVKRNIEKVKGRIDVKSTVGEGTQVILRIPLTLAIVEGMLVGVGDSLYTVPILSIIETIKVDHNQITTTMEGDEIVKIREILFPVLRLHELHHLQPEYKELTDGVLLVMEHNDKSFCLFVDKLLGMQQTVIKGFSGYLKNLRGVSGCAILGNGDVSLILDVGTLLNIRSSNEELLAS